MPSISTDIKPCFTGCEVVLNSLNPYPHLSLALSYLLEHDPDKIVVLPLHELHEGRLAHFYTMICRSTREMYSRGVLFDRASSILVATEASVYDRNENSSRNFWFIYKTQKYKATTSRVVDKTMSVQAELSYLHYLSPMSCSILPGGRSNRS